MKEITIFIKRLEKAGVNIELVSNYPWIYIDRINGKRVTEKYEANHGFTAFWVPVNRERPIIMTDITEVFKLIRKYTKDEVV